MVYILDVIQSNKYVKIKSKNVNLPIKGMADVGCSSLYDTILINKSQDIYPGFYD